MHESFAAPSRLLTEVPRPAAMPLASSAAKRRPLVMVLGMHRSGTSLCAHVLSALGVDMADTLVSIGHDGPAPDNPRGHWERWEVLLLHNRILELLNRDYLQPTHDFGFPVAWWADPAITQVRRE